MSLTLNFTGLRVEDPIRAVLMASGASAADLSTYDAAPVGSSIVLSNATLAFWQTVRTNAISMMAGYRINGPDSFIDTVTTGATSGSTAVTQLAGASLLVANTLPIFACLYTGGGGNAGNFNMRRSTTAYTSTSLITAGTVFNTNAFPECAYPAGSARWNVMVCKRPPASRASSIDTNADGAFSGSIGLGSTGTFDFIQLGGYAGTTYSMGNAGHRTWQAIACATNLW